LVQVEQSIHLTFFRVRVSFVVSASKPSRVRSLWQGGPLLLLVR